MRLVEPAARLTSAAAIAAVTAAMAAADARDIRIAAAVVDAGGNLMAFLRSPGCFLQSIGIAIDKAYTAAGFGFASSDWPAVLKDDEDLREGLRMVPRLVMIGGGFPLRVEGMVVGAIGVSGGTESEDVICARAGLAALGLE